MINVGDTVKIIKPTQDASGDPGELKEYIPIGTICTILNITEDKNGIKSYECKANTWHDHLGGFWYLRDEIEKGHYEWIKDE